MQGARYLACLQSHGFERRRIARSVQNLSDDGLSTCVSEPPVRTPETAEIPSQNMRRFRFCHFFYEG